MKRFLLIASFLSTYGFAASVCTIQISNEKYSGEKVKITFHSRLNTKQECAALAKLHQANFQGQEVKVKQVGYLWANEPEARPTKQLSVATKRGSSHRRYR